MIWENIEEIKEEDLQDLVDNKVSEKKTLEYKLLLRVKDPDEKVLRLGGGQRIQIRDGHQENNRNRRGKAELYEGGANPSRIKSM